MSTGAALREGTAEQAGLRPEKVERAREIAAEAVSSGRTPSLVVLAARRGVVVLHEAFGRLRPDTDDTPLPRDAVFPLTSASKPITATLAMILVEDGLLGLARPAVDYLPELRGEGIEQVLVHHLMTHSSGFDDDAYFELIQKKVATDGPPEIPPGVHPLKVLMMHYAGEAPRSCLPGEKMLYGNFNYTLLGEIVERASGQTLDDFARERLFEPLGMTGTGYTVRDEVRGRLLERAQDAPLSRNFLSPALPGLASEPWRQMQDGGAGLHGCALDLAIFAQMYLNGGSYGGVRILSPASVAEASQDQVPGLRAQIRGMPERDAGYGYGWLIQGHERWRYFSPSLPARGTYSHTGAGGVSLWIDPSHEIVGVYLEVTTQVTEDLESASWAYDLFQNVITAAVDD